MILADTSIWIDHFRSPNTFFQYLLTESQIYIHPVIIGEIYLGSLKDRRTLILNLLDLPMATVAQDSEVLRLIDDRGLYGTGIGYPDAHLLTSTLLTAGCKFWTNDKRLQVQAVKLGVSVASH